MTPIEGKLIRLRAVEPQDIDPMYQWENDPSIWRVSGTTTPFSRHVLERFIEEQQFDIFQTRQQRLIIEIIAENTIIGALDLFELDVLNSRAGIGILIYPAEVRRRGYASDAISTVCRYAREILRLHQLWCNVGTTNEASIALFRSAGFTEIGIKREWIWSPEGYTDEILFQKLLEE